MAMQKAIVSYPSKGSTNEVERFIIKEAGQMEHYKECFPLHYPHIKSHFHRELNEGNILIINDKGGWCIETENIKIVKYID